MITQTAAQMFRAFFCIEEFLNSLLPRTMMKSVATSSKSVDARMVQPFGFLTKESTEVGNRPQLVLSSNLHSRFHRRQS